MPQRNGFRYGGEFSYYDSSPHTFCEPQRKFQMWKILIASVFATIFVAGGHYAHMRLFANPVHSVHRWDPSIFQVPLSKKKEVSYNAARVGPLKMLEVDLDFDGMNPGDRIDMKMKGKLGGDDLDDFEFADGEEDDAPATLGMKDALWGATVPGTEAAKPSAQWDSNTPPTYQRASITNLDNLVGVQQPPLNQAQARGPSSFAGPAPFVAGYQETQDMPPTAPSNSHGAGSLLAAGAAVAGVAAVAGAAAAQGSRKPAKGPSPKDRTLYIGRCPGNITDDHVRKHFRELGEDAIIEIDWVTKGGKFQGYGYVEFRDAVLAKKAASYAPISLGTRACVHWLGDNADTQMEISYRESRTVFHGRCPDVITDDHIWKHYAPLGQDAISAIRWANDPNGLFKGFGFVEFKTVELAKAALSMPPLRVAGQMVVKQNNTSGGKTAVSPKRARERARALIDAAQMKKRSSGISNNRNTFESLSDLPKLTWMPEKLAAQPFKKDFSSSISYHPHNEMQVKQFMAENKIHLEGTDTPAIMEFSEVDFGSEINSYLTNNFETPSPIQRVGWPVVLSGRDTIGLAQTGSGKTLAFGLPAITHVKAQQPVGEGQGPIALILAPTRELVLQSYKELEKFEHAAGIQVGIAYGGQDGGANKYNQGAKLVSGCEIVVATPGRLIDFYEAGVVPLDRVTFLVVDEADQMLDMGFEPQVRAIIDQLRPDRQTVMFSATWDKDVQKLAWQFLRQPAKVIVNNAEDLHANPDITQKFIFHNGDRFEKEDMLVNVVRKLKEHNQDHSKMLIFVETRSYVDSVVQKLSRNFRNVHGIHGDISQGARERALASLREDPHGILVATDVVSRGLDIKDLACVVNLEMPTEVARYIHRIGRTGRAGKPGLAVSFMTTKDASLASDLVKTLGEAGQEVPQQLMQMIPIGRQSPARSQRSRSAPVGRSMGMGQSRMNHGYGGDRGYGSGKGMNRNSSPYGKYNQGYSSDDDYQRDYEDDTEGYGGYGGYGSRGRSSGGYNRRQGGKGYGGGGYGGGGYGGGGYGGSGYSRSQDYF